MMGNQNVFKTFFKIFIIALFSLCLNTNLYSQDTIYYFSDFEIDDGNLNGSGCWEWGLPTAGPDYAHSGFLCWGTNLDGNYPSYAHDSLDTPEIDLTQASSAQLTFWHWYEMEADLDQFFDGSNVKITSDGNSYEILTPLRGYDGILDNFDNPLNQEPVFSGLDTGKQWKIVRFNLQKYVGKTIRLRFTIASDYSIEYSGWYIDDLKVKDNLDRDAAIWSIDAPQKKIDFYLAPFKLQVNVYNAGSHIITFEVQVKIFQNDLEVYHSSKNALNLEADSLTKIEFEPWYPDQEATYQLEAYTSLTGDEDSSNDTLQAEIQIIKSPLSNVTEQCGIIRLIDKYWEFNEASYVSWADYNNDGLFDLYTTQKTLFKNNGNGLFSADIDLPETWNYNPGTSWEPDQYYVCWGDFDNDGDQDLLVPHRANENPVTPGNLLRNEGNGFVDVTDEAFGGDLHVMDMFDVGWFDYNNDGHLDIYIGSHTKDINNYLFHNEGNGTFKSVSDSMGINKNPGPYFIIFDYDNDQFLDLFLYGYLNRHLLYHNESDGTFTNRTVESGIAIIDEPVDWITAQATPGDFNNDGFLDLYVTRAWAQDGLYLNNRDGTFSPLFLPDSIQDTGYPEVRAVDYDNDGYLDLCFTAPAYLAKSGLILYRNVNGGVYFAPEHILSEKFVGSDEAGQGQHWLDYDNDGDVDLFTSGGGGSLFRNNWNNNNWLQIQLKGIEINRSGIGAHILLKNKGQLQMREIMAGSCWKEPNIPVAYFGLGLNHMVDTLQVFWPSGKVDVIEQVTANQILTIEEGKGIISGIGDHIIKNNKAKGYAISQNFPNPFNPKTTIEFDIPKTSDVTLRIYNILGEEVATLVSDRLIAGSHSYQWDAGNLASGVYLYRLSAGSFTKKSGHLVAGKAREYVETRKMVLMR